SHKGIRIVFGVVHLATEEPHKQDSVIEGVVYKDDTVYFGLVQGFNEEWGYFSKVEIERLKLNVWEIEPQDLPYTGRRK
ncbi:MAG: hypothetical protein ACYDH0_10470, partial [Candidatus Aminicenantales bacterium]